jgi:hypothetical protein
VLPHEGFNQRVGVYVGHHVSPDGQILDDAAWEADVDGWLPSAAEQVPESGALGVAVVAGAGRAGQRRW